MKNVTKLIDTNLGHKLQITDIGKGKPVVFIAGWPLASEIFDPQFIFLVQNGYRAIGITLRGFGASDHPETQYNFEEFAMDINAALEHLKLENAVLCGFSMGGFIAAYYMAKYSPLCVEKLLLFSCNAPSTTIQEDYPFGITKDAFNGLISLIDQDPFSISDVYGPLFKLNEEIIPLNVGNWINANARKASKMAMVNSMIATRDTDLRSQLPKIFVPTAIFHAVNDNVIPYEIAMQAYKLIPNSTLTTFQDGGHWIFLLEQEKFNAELLNFIS
jgi:pimeloyl-ACP methyl ester carboxylesterase